VSKKRTPEDEQLLSSIETLLAQGENQISLPLTALNQGIAKLSMLSAKTITGLQNSLIKSINQANVASENDLDPISMAILRPLQDWQEQNNLLLTQLAASSGLTQPGDSLEMALVNQIAEEPELAYSATLLIAIRDMLPYASQLIEVLREIRDRMRDVPVHFRGEPLASAPAFEVDLADAAIPAQRRAERE
jgi:hypothetical protein